MITQVVKTRRLPSPGHILVNVGDTVRATTPVGVVDYIPGPLFRVNVAEGLGIGREHIDDVLVRRTGEWVGADEPVAVSDEFYVERVSTSPKPGHIGLRSRSLGHVYIREPLPVGAKEPVIIRAADEGWTPVAFTDNLVVKVGDTVEFRQTLLSTGASFADIVGRKRVKRQPIHSPVHGRITDISVRDCTIVIRPLRQQTEVLAHVSGRVTAVDPTGLAEITATGHVVQGVIGYGGESIGALAVLPGGAERDIEPADLPGELAGAVIVGRYGISREALQICLSGDVAGLVLGSARRSVLRDALGADPVRAVGAAAETAATIILLSGFGVLPMPDETYAELARLNGRPASLDGSTQLRAGVVRPEVIVPDEADGREGVGI